MPPLSPFSVTIIGFGAFGALMARHLAALASVAVHDSDPAALARADAAGLPVISDPAQIRSQVVVLAVPVQTLPACLRRLAPHLGRGQLVVDVCSIKQEPARMMQEILGPEVELLASHPMFGPASGADGIAGQQIVLCPLRGQSWRRLAAALRRRLGLRVIVTTPEDHDRQAAFSQGLIHLLAQIVPPRDKAATIRTKSYDLLAQAIAMVSQDAPEVVEAITRRNPHMAELRAHLRQALAQEA